MDTNSIKSPYDIILESEFLLLLGIALNYYDKETIHWGGTGIPMKELGALQDNSICEAIYFAHTQPPLLQDLEERQQRILDADYSKVDIDVFENALSIFWKSKQQLKATLKKFPILFGGRLGLLKIKPVTTELQKHAKFYSGRYYNNIPKSMEDPLKKEIHRVF